MQKQQEHATVPLTLFYAYAQEDERFRLGLEKHLSALRRQGLIAEWYDRKILPGSDVAQTVDGHLLTAQVILLLISPDFLASDYWTDERLQHVLERQAKGETQVIPILIRPVD